MRKTVFAAILALACGVPALSLDAQNVIYDPFRDNSGQWYTTAQKEVTLEIKDGEYQFRHTSPSWYTCWRNFGFNRSGNWGITVKAKRTRGAAQEGYGLVIGSKDQDNFFALMIGAEGYYSLWKIQMGSWSPIVNWGPGDPLLKGENAFNEFGLKNQESVWEIWINGVMVMSLNADVLFGDNFGFIVSGDQDVSFDDFQITEGSLPASTISNKPFSLAENFNNNERNWPAGQDSVYGIRIEEGWMKLSLNSRGKGKVYTSLPVLPDLFCDFRISADVKYVSGNPLGAFGLFYGKGNLQTSCGVFVDAGGKFACDKLENEQGSQNLIPWTFDPILKTGSAVNTLVAEKRGNDLTLIINGKKVGSANPGFSGGRNVGFFASSDQEVWFDNLKVERLVNNLVASESFTFQNYNWCTDASGKTESEIRKNNTLLITHKDAARPFFCLKETAMDMTRDFDISLDVQLQPGNREGGAGFSFWASGMADGNANPGFYSFLIFPNGKYGLYQSTLTGVGNPLREIPGSVREDYQLHTLMMKRTGSTCAFLLDGKEVFRHEGATGNGPQCGLVVSGMDTQAVFDNFRIVQH